MSDPDPRREQEQELVLDAFSLAMTGADADEINATLQQLEQVQDDCLPDPGTARIQFPGPARPVPKHEVICPDCGKALRGGGGVRFADLGMSDQEWTVEIHRYASGPNACPRLRYRWQRWSLNRSPWARVQRRWSSYVWRHDNWLVHFMAQRHNRKRERAVNEDNWT